MILIEVVYKVPESLLVFLFRAEQIQVDLEVPFVVELPANVIIEAGRRLKVCLELLVPAASALLLLLRPSKFGCTRMHLFADGDFEPWFTDRLTTEGA